MKTEKETGTAPEEIRILTFSIADICFGMDMEEIGGMLPPDQISPREYRLFYFHEKLPFADRKIIYRSPMILLLNDSERRSGICIDQPEDMNVPVPIDSIRPMPPLIAARSRSFPIWGVTVKKERMILLTDFYKLMEYAS